MRYLILALVGFVPMLADAGPPSFRHVTIDPNAGRVCYAVTAADVNNDQKPDIVVVTENQVLWYEAPDLDQACHS